MATKRVVRFDKHSDQDGNYFRSYSPAEWDKLVTSGPETLAQLSEINVHKLAQRSSILTVRRDVPRIWQDHAET
jgi:hypothetical protein